jgi:hypothetical protein
MLCTRFSTHSPVELYRLSNSSEGMGTRMNASGDHCGEVVLNRETQNWNRVRCNGVLKDSDATGFKAFG